MKYPKKSHPGRAGRKPKKPELKNVVVAGSVPFSLAAWYHSHTRGQRSKIMAEALRREHKRKTRLGPIIDK